MVRIVAVYSEGIEEEQQAEEIERELMQERGLELVLAQVLERELGLAQELESGRSWHDWFSDCSHV